MTPRFALAILLAFVLTFGSFPRPSWAACLRCERSLGEYCCVTAWRGLCCELPLAPESSRRAHSALKGYRRTRRHKRHHNSEESLPFLLQRLLKL